MADKGEPYIMILRPAPRSPMAFTRASPSSANCVTKMAVPRNPTFKIPARIVVLA